MKLPDVVVIGPHRYRVEVIPDGILEGAGADGLCQPRRNVIAVDGGQPPTQLADCIMHEATHGLLAVVKLEDDVEEAIALALGPALVMFIRDNPELIRAIAKATR